MARSSCEQRQKLLPGEFVITNAPLVARVAGGMREASAQEFAEQLNADPMGIYTARVVTPACGPDGRTIPGYGGVAVRRRSPARS